jgi:hypothetical protein
VCKDAETICIRSESMWEELPPFLTVEQAARQLQVGRTTAYELTIEWERTGGQSGLPFVWFGHQKRVPTSWILRQSETGSTPPAS